MKQFDFSRPFGFGECKEFVDEYRTELLALVEYYQSKIFDCVERDDLFFGEEGDAIYVDYSCMDAVNRLLIDAYGIDIQQINPKTAWGLSDILRMTVTIEEMIKSGEIRRS